MDKAAERNGRVAGAALQAHAAKRSGKCTSCEPWRHQVARSRGNRRGTKDATDDVWRFTKGGPVSIPMHLRTPGSGPAEGCQNADDSRQLAIVRALADELERCLGNERAKESIREQLGQELARLRPSNVEGGTDEGVGRSGLDPLALKVSASGDDGAR